MKKRFFLLLCAVVLLLCLPAAQAGADYSRSPVDFDIRICDHAHSWEGVAVEDGGSHTIYQAIITSEAEQRLGIHYDSFLGFLFPDGYEELHDLTEEEPVITFNETTNTGVGIYLEQGNMLRVKNGTSVLEETEAKFNVTCSWLGITRHCELILAFEEVPLPTGVEVPAVMDLQVGQESTFNVHFSDGYSYRNQFWGGGSIGDRDYDGFSELFELNYDGSTMHIKPRYAGVFTGEMQIIDNNISMSTPVLFRIADENGHVPDPDPSIPQDVVLSAATFPDEAFRAFISSKYDRNGDGILGSAEIACVHEIILGGVESCQNSTTTLKGIEIFPNLKVLYAPQMAELTGPLDLRFNTALESVRIPECGKLTGLRLGNLPNLRSLICAKDRELDGLDFSGCPALEELNIDQLWLGTLDLSTLPNLKLLNCPSNNLTELDLSHNPELTILGCNHNQNLTALDLRYTPKLKTLNIFYTGITEIDLSHTPELRQVVVHHTPLTELDISPCPILVGLIDPDKLSIVEDRYVYQSVPGPGDYDRVDYSPTTTLITDGSVAITADNFPDEVFRRYVSQTWDTSGDGLLSWAEIAGITEIDLSGNDACKSGVTSLKGIEFFTSLKTLYAPQMAELSGTLDLSGNTVLESVRLPECGKLTGLTLGRLPNLRILVCAKTGIRALDYSGCPALEVLNVDSLHLGALDLSGLPNLRELTCPRNDLTALDVSHNPALTTLWCNINPLTSLNLWNNPELVSMLVFQTDITELDLRGNPSLRQIAAEDSALTRLDISGCPVLLELVNSVERHEGNNTVSYESGSGHQADRLVYPAAATLITDGSVAITADNFPDEAFRQYISDKFDTDHNGTLSAEEIAAVEMIVVCYYEPWVAQGFQTEEESIYVRDNVHDRLTSLDGIEHFTNLRHLFAFNMPKLAGTIDLRKNIRLCGIDIRGNRGVTDVLFGASYPGMFEIRCGKLGGISRLDLSAFPNLEELNVEELWLQNLDLSHNVHLKSLQCASNGLTELDLSHNPELVFLACNHNQNLSSLDLSHNPKLMGLNIFVTGITDIDLSQTPKLRQLCTQYTAIAELDISPCQNLVALLSHPEYYQDKENCHLYESGTGNQDDRLFYDKATLLKTGDSVPIAEALFPDGAFRQYVSDVWDTNGDGTLSAEEIAAVEMIVVCTYEPWVAQGFLTQAQADYIRDNLHDKLTSLKGIEYFTNLKHLFAFGMPKLAGTIDLSRNTMLESIDISNNSQVTDVLFAASYPYLTELRCGRLGGISGLDLSAFPALEQLNIDQLWLQTLDLSHNEHLKMLQCPSNGLTELDLSHNPELLFLACNHNQNLTSLDLSHNPELMGLNIFVTGITDIDLSFTPKLRQLSAQYAPINVLDISPCQSLVALLAHSEYYQDKGDCHLYETGSGNQDDRLFYSKAALLKTAANQTFAIFTLPASLTRIETEAFAGITADKVVLPSGCESVASRAFAACPNLKIVIAPAGTAFADDAFQDSENVYVFRRES